MGRRLENGGSYHRGSKLYWTIYLVMGPGPAGVDGSGKVQEWGRATVEEAQLELFETHSAIPILIQLVE